ncbi:hypothetical protein HMI56_003224 [Coelomomyces lativittatus]|nr:hypothetical protein HMI56_003224 [Coelomomyces lativittatus]
MQGYYVEGIQVKCNLVAERHLPVSSELDDSETVGLKLNPQSRSELMHKLARSERQSLPAPPFHFSPSTSHLPASVNLDQLPSHAKTRCLMLTNMFNPLEETEINWDKDIEVDVKEECQQSYGPVSHIRVIRASPGHVYIKFGTLLAAERAFTALNGRWFSSRQITASYLSETAYNMKFPEAITV